MIAEIFAFLAGLLALGAVPQLVAGKLWGKRAALVVSCATLVASIIALLMADGALEYGIVALLPFWLGWVVSSMALLMKSNSKGTAQQ